jgi:hypothetical protein
MERAGSGKGEPAQMNDAAFLTELKAWIRFSAAEAERTVEVGAIRPQFAAAFGLGSQRPDPVVRFGRIDARP